MATPAWQPRAGLPASASMAGPQGLWGPPGVPMNQGHAPPQLPLPGAPPLNFPPQMSGSLPPFGNPNQLSPASGSGLQPSRPVSFWLYVSALHIPTFVVHYDLLAERLLVMMW